MFQSFGSFALAFAAGLVVTSNAFSEESHNLRFGAVVILLMFLHGLMRGRLWFSRELLLYVAFAAYNALSLVWTSDVNHGIPNVQLTVNYILVFMLFSALVIFHDRRAVLGGILIGFLVGAVTYTRTSGFPFAYPEDFSYNTIAGMYLFGLFMTAVYGWYRRARILPISIGLVLMLLIAATTSIKTNLGVLLGSAAAGLIYFSHTVRAIRRSAIIIAAFASLIAYLVVSNDALMQRLEGGYARVSMGADVLLAREDANGSAGLGTRETWKDAGIKGWMTNPVFGDGVEAFRGDFGVTSHSTPVDLLYNTGLIGCLLFYATFGSTAWRLLRAQEPHTRSPRALIFGAVTCYAFISLSGTMYYDMFLAAVMSISIALVARPALATEMPSDSVVAIHS